MYTDIHKWRIFKMALKLTSIECSKRFFLVSQNNSHYGQRGCVMDFIIIIIIAIICCSNFFPFIRCFLLLYGFKMQFFFRLFIIITILYNVACWIEWVFFLYSRAGLFFEAFLKLSEFLFDWLRAHVVSLFQDLICFKWLEKFSQLSQLLQKYPSKLIELHYVTNKPYVNWKNCQEILIGLLNKIQRIILSIIIVIICSTALH